MHDPACMPSGPPRGLTTARFRSMHRRPARGPWFRSISCLVALYVLGIGLPALLVTQRAGLSLSLLATPTATYAAAASCRWTEPPRTYPEGVSWVCGATDWSDGDTLTAVCEGLAGPVSIRVRGVDTDERGESRYWQAELRRRTAGHALALLPHHHGHRRVVADVLAAGVNVGAAMDAAGWSKADCPKR